MQQHDDPDDQKRLFQAALNGDTEAQACLFDERLLRAIRTQVRREQERRGLRFPPEALDDVVQDVCIAVLERLPGRPVEHPRAFLAIVARNVLLTAFRRFLLRSRILPLELDGDTAPEPIDLQPLPDEQVLSRLTLERVWETLMTQMEGREKDILTLKVVHGLEPREIATVLNTTSSTISNALTRIYHRRIAPLLAHEQEGI